LKFIYRDLKELAAQGDAHAACRLAVELSRCANAKELARKASETEMEAQQFDPSSPRGQLAAQMAPRLRTISSQTNEVCQGFSPDPGDQAWRYQLQAAQAGDVPSMLGFVSGIHSGLDPKNPLATPEAWDAYRQYAPQLIGQAVETGTPGAYQLAATLSRFPLFGMQVLPQDPVRAAAYYMALQSAATPEYAQVMGKAIAALNLSPDDLARASTMAVSLSAKLQNVDGPIDLSSNFITGSKAPDSKPGSECSR
jgi:hypothetical protein